MLPGSSTLTTTLFYGCGNHLKLLKCVAVVTGEIVLEERRLYDTGTLSYPQIGTGAPQHSRWQISFMLPKDRKTPEKLWPNF